MVVPLFFLLYGVGVVVLTGTALSVARGERVRLVELVRVPHAFDAVVAVVVTGLVILGGNIVGVVGIVAAYFFWLTLPVLIDQRCGAFHAVAESCRLMARNSGSVIGVFAIAWVLQIVGVFTVVGWILTVPVGVLMAVHTYFRLTGRNTAR